MGELLLQIKSRLNFKNLKLDRNESQQKCSMIPLDFFIKIFCSSFDKQYKDAPCINIESVEYLTLYKKVLSKSAYCQGNDFPHGYFTQELPKGVKNSVQSNGTSTYFLHNKTYWKDIQTLSDSILPPLQLELDTSTKIMQQLEWCIVLFDEKMAVVDILDLADYIFTPTCNAFGPTITVYIRNMREKLPKKYSISNLYLDLNDHNNAPYTKALYEFQLPCNAAHASSWLLTFYLCGGKYVSFNQMFKKISKLGKGSFSNIFLYANKITGELVVLKCVEKHCLVKANAFMEIHMLKLATHGSIIKLFECFSNSSTIVLATEYIKGGSIYKYVKSYNRFSEKLTFISIYKLLKTINSLHSRGILHRDLKSENILLRDPDDMSSLVLIDFGLSTTLGSKEMQMRCGSPGFVAPELFESNVSYGLKSDIFSIGAIMYIMLTGTEPFVSDNNEKVLKKNSRCEVMFDHPALLSCSEECRSLLGWLLQKNPADRCTSSQAILHPWFTNQPLLPGPSITSNNPIFLSRIPTTQIFNKSITVNTFSPQHESSYQQNIRDRVLSVYQ